MKVAGREMPGLDEEFWVKIASNSTISRNNELVLGLGLGLGSGQG